MRRPRRWAVVVAAAVAALWRRPSCSGRPSGRPWSSPPPALTLPSQPATGDQPVVPKTGLYLGAWARPANATQDGRVQAFDQVETELGEPLAISHTYRTFSQPIGSASDVALTSGHYLMISWASGDTRRINRGLADKIIISHARQVKALRRPVFVRFRWEMDRADLADTVHSPADYQAAWRHVRAIFAQQHVTNASWVWCPTAYGFDSGRAQEYYPGDDEVDWVCADGYAFTDPGQPPRPFREVMQSFFAWARGHAKPIMIAEFGVDRSFRARRGPWIAAIAATVRAQPNVKALVYFDDGTEGRWSLDADPSGFAGLRTLAHEVSAQPAPD